MISHSVYSLTRFSVEFPIMRPFGSTLRGSLTCNLRTENEAGAFATLG